MGNRFGEKSMPAIERITTRSVTLLDPTFDRCVVNVTTPLQGFKIMYTVNCVRHISGNSPQQIENNDAHGQYN